MSKDTEIRDLQKALKVLKVNESPEEAKKKLAGHVGFSREKEKFSNNIYLYAVTKGDFWPIKEVICYVGAPGTGKTSFVQRVAEAMSRPIETISCAGLKNLPFSVKGDKDKPSLVAWAIKKNRCKNPVILFDELEKVDNVDIQNDLSKLFKNYQKKDYKFTDPYFQKEIELHHITFFATVNYQESLAPELKNNLEMRRLEDYEDEDKEKILKLTKEKIEKKLQELYGKEVKEVIPDSIIKELPKFIKEAGVRQTERALYKIAKDYIYAREKGENFSLDDPKKWLKDNVFPYQESFRYRWHHYCLFGLWGITWVLLLIAIVKKIILRKEKQA